MFSSYVMHWKYVGLAAFPFPPPISSKLFKDTTLFFLCLTPNLATVIPAMDHIDAHLATASHNSKYSPAICASLALGKAHLYKYYTMTDHSEVYRIAMSEYSFLWSPFSITYLLNSLTSTTQTSIFPQRQVGRRVDRHRNQHCPRRVFASLCGPPRRK